MGSAMVRKEVPMEIYKSREVKLHSSSETILFSSRRLMSPIVKVFSRIVTIISLMVIL